MERRIESVQDPIEIEAAARVVDPAPLEEEAAAPVATWRVWLERPHRLWDATLLLSFAVLVTLAAWLYLTADQRAQAPVQASRPANPALALKQEAGRLWAAEQREAALAKWQAAHELAPENPAITEDLARAQVGVAADYLRANDPDRALPLLEAAYTLMPEEEAVLHEYQALLAYHAGRDAVAAQEWDRALDALYPLYNLDTTYLDVQELLEIALAGQQQARAEQRALSEQAGSQARTAAPGQRVAALLTPPEVSNEPGQAAPPTLGLLAPKSGKHVVVSINAQRMYVYENGQLIWNWVASTGEAARPTVPGRYRVQSKIDNARSNVWSLWMPYWEGIYWAGSVENGIHGQVTFDRGGRLWEGYLGTRITFGCVMISDTNAATLYNWTEIGYPVSIHWEWNPAWVPDENGDPL